MSRAAISVGATRPIAIDLRCCHVDTKLSFESQMPTHKVGELVGAEPGREASVFDSVQHCHKTAFVRFLWLSRRVVPSSPR
jgi:hypothetical protein